MGRISDLKAGRAMVKQSCRVKNYCPGGVSESLEERYKKYLTIKHKITP
jgi:hypothetical protein